MERLASSVSVVTTLLGVSRSTTYELVAEGAIPAIRSRTRRKRIARAVVEQLRDAAHLDPSTHDSDHPAPNTAGHAPSTRHSASLHPGPSNPIHTVAPRCAMTRAAVTGG